MVRNFAKKVLPSGIVEMLRRAVRGQHFNEVAVVWEAMRDMGGERVMFDVGAHHGDTSKPFADGGWRVFAFEPDEENRRILTETLGKSANVTVDSRAASNRSAAGVQFYSSDVSSGISGLSAFHESHVQSGTVDTVTLAEVVKEADVRTVDLLKIDTEGHDLFVLQGVDWSTTVPEVVVCEFENAKSVPLGYTFDDLAKFLHDRGYQLLVSEWYPIVEYGRAHRWRGLSEYPCDLADEGGWGNIIAVKDPDLYQVVRREADRAGREHAN